MRIGIIDLGTNAARLDVYEINRRRRARRLHRERIRVRLGENLFSKGRLDPRASARALSALKRFKSQGTHYGVSRLTAYGTSALRSASDRAVFIRKAKGFGVPVKVISGAEEALLIARGILSGTRIKNTAALMDLGGGSCEITICRGRNILSSACLSLGTMRLQELFLSDRARKSLSPESSLEALRRHIRRRLRAAFGAPKAIPWVIGSGGTLRALTKLKDYARPRGKSAGRRFLDRKSLAHLIVDLCFLTLPQIKRIKGMEPQRARMILAGAVVLEETMMFLGASKLTTTPLSLREGLLHKELQQELKGR